MKILGIDTSTRYLSIGACDGEKVSEYNLDAGRMHSALLVPAIQRVVSALGWELRQVDYFACGMGPGSFTGLRIAASTIKGLAYGLRKPVIAVSSLDVIAQNARYAGIAGRARVMAIVDAKRKLVYAGNYDYDKGVLKRTGPLRLAPIAEVIAGRKAGSIALGDGLGVYQKEVLAAGFRVLDKDYWYPAGRGVIALALASVQTKKFTDAFRLNPVYLYPQECQVKHG